MSIEKLKEFREKSGEVIRQRELLKHMGMDAERIIPKLPTYSKGIFTLFFTHNIQSNPFAVPELGKVFVRMDCDGNVQELSLVCGSLIDDHLKEWSLKNLRDILCKFLGNPTQEELDSVVVAE
jgi:hypothetical protein